MLKSLFGELTPMRESSGRRDVEKNEFASTAVMETVINDTSEHRPAADRHLRELFVTGSAAQAMRAHFASTQEDQSSSHGVITLFDPAQMWAGAVVKALSDASGQPIEKLQLRDQANLHTLAVIERTTLPRRQDETLKIYHADVQAQGTAMTDIPCALMERSDLTAVIVGPLHPSIVDEMLAALLRASGGPNWRCADLLFMLPVGAAWISQKIEAATWPSNVRVEIIAEPLTSASTVWNKLLAHWNRIKPHHGGADEGVATSPHHAGSAAAHHTPAYVAAYPQGGGQPATALSTAVPTKPAAALSPLIAAVSQGVAGASSVSLEPSTEGRRPPDTDRANAILHELMLLDGLIFAALVDSVSGAVVTSEGRGPDIDRAAAAATEVMQVHRRTLRQMGHWRPNEPVDEILVTAGSRYHILRTLQAHPDFFILAVLDKLRSNLAMTRFRIMEAQQALV